jgi:protein-L-isoaspartate(D-aspartate) O-methyltransferase
MNGTHQHQADEYHSYLQRERMVLEQLVARGIQDENVLDAMRTVPREVFVPDHLKEVAYGDFALPIREGQTISQPYIVALMIEALELSGDDHVLEVGTGSGYGAAVLSRIASEVYTIERHEELARSAQVKFQALGYGNIHVLHGDGTLGWPDHAPYDAIIVTAGGPQIPDPLFEQLTIGGRLVLPQGSRLLQQELVRIRKVSESNYKREKISDVRFVPLIGEEGWPES